jgi:hypothetical protein
MKGTMARQTVGPIAPGRGAHLSINGRKLAKYC